MIKDSDSTTGNELLKGAYRWTIGLFLEYSKLSDFHSPIFYIKGVFWQIRMSPNVKEYVRRNKVSTFVSLYIVCLGPFYPKTNCTLKIPSYYFSSGSIIRVRKECKFSRESSSICFQKMCESSSICSNEFRDNNGLLSVEVELDWESPLSASDRSLSGISMGTNDTLRPFCLKFSDFTLSGPKYSLPTHKATLATLSPFFEYLVTAPFSENQKSCAFFSDVDEGTARAVIAFAEKRNPFEELKRYLSLKKSKTSILQEESGIAEGKKRQIYSELSTYLKLEKDKMDDKGSSSSSVGLSILKEFPNLSIEDLDHWGLGIEVEPAKKTHMREHEWVDALLRLLATGERFSILPLVEECSRRLACLIDTSNALKIAKVCLLLSPGWLPTKKSSKELHVESLVEVTTEFILSELDFFVDREDFAQFAEKNLDYMMKLFAISCTRRSLFAGEKETIGGQ